MAPPPASWRRLLNGALICALGGVAIRLMEMGGEFAVILMPGVAWVIGRWAGRNARTRARAIMLALGMTYAAALLTHIAYMYEMLRGKSIDPMLAAIFAVPLSAAYPLFAALGAPFYAVMFLVSLGVAGVVAYRSFRALP